MLANKSKVIIGATARGSARDDLSLSKQAEAVASAITVPAGIEFARFDHRGRTYALSARLLVEVDLLEHRVPDVVVRQGEAMRPKAPRRRAR